MFPFTNLLFSAVMLLSLASVTSFVAGTITMEVTNLHGLEFLILVVIALLKALTPRMGMQPLTQLLV